MPEGREGGHSCEGPAWQWLDPKDHEEVPWILRQERRGWPQQVGEPSVQVCLGEAGVGAAAGSGAPRLWTGETGDRVWGGSASGVWGLQHCQVLGCVQGCVCGFCGGKGDMVEAGRGRV